MITAIDDNQVSFKVTGGRDPERSGTMTRPAFAQWAEIEVKQMARHPEIYASSEWRKVRRFVIVRANGLCEECQRQGRIEVGKEVDHINELTFENKHLWDIAYNPDNLQLLCPACHNIKHGRCTGLHFFADCDPIKANSNRGGPANVDRKALTFSIPAMLYRTKENRASPPYKK